MINFRVPTRRYADWISGDWIGKCVIAYLELLVGLLDGGF